jgi:riboflavin synthase
MFTGIIETMGCVRAIEQEGSNVHFFIESAITAELKIDQSIAHDGVCLTVVALAGHQHQVTAVAETLERSNLGRWEVGQMVNLERCMKLGDRLDGHLVQGHVDTRATCIAIDDKDGSWELCFEYNSAQSHLIVEKGSVCLNGISLTVVRPAQNRFWVAIIPYTWAHTNLSRLKVGEQVNIEFDIIGKYIERFIDQRNNHIP